MGFLNIFKRKNTKMPSDPEALYSDNRDMALARYILNHGFEKKIDGDGISASSDTHVQLVITDVDSLMLCVAWHGIQVSHFPNFNEKQSLNRTKITILAPGFADETTLKGLKATLDAKFGNLMQYCPWTMRLADGNILQSANQQKSFVDIEIEIIGLKSGGVETYMSKDFVPEENALTTVVAHAGALSDSAKKKIESSCHQLYIIPADLNPTEEELRIDTRFAKLINLVYLVSVDLTAIDPKDTEEIKSYRLPLNIYMHSFTTERAEKEWRALNRANKLSNLYCLDGFEYKLRSAGSSVDASKEEITLAVRNNLADLARTEHARWNVEKLLLGFRPFSPKESLKDENLFGAEQKAYRKQMKKQHVHVDLCSYRALKRIDIDSVKYDCFMMLAIPVILKDY